MKLDWKDAVRALGTGAAVLIGTPFVVGFLPASASIVWGPVQVTQLITAGVLAFVTPLALSKVPQLN